MSSIYLLSDLHINYPENWQWLNSIKGHENDILIIAGDISHDLSELQKCLHTLVRRFLSIFFIPGNTDLWVTGGEKISSMDKLNSILTICENVGVETKPKEFAHFWIVPLFSWYDSSFAKQDTLTKSDVEELRGYSDVHFCKWKKGTSPLSLFERNEEFIKAFDISNTKPVISFSHFLPRRSLLPPRSELKQKYLPHVVGSSRIEQQIRQLGSTVHCFGHTHVKQRQTLDEPKWAALPFGVFICHECSGSHRHLGPQVSFVKSTNLDVWRMDEVQKMQIGNIQANKYLEANLPYDYERPHPKDGNLTKREKFIREKYQRKLWADKNGTYPTPSPRPAAVKTVVSQPPPSLPPVRVPAQTTTTSQRGKRNDPFSRFDDSSPVPANQHSPPLIALGSLSRKQNDFGSGTVEQSQPPLAPPSQTRQVLNRSYQLPPPPQQGISAPQRKPPTVPVIEQTNTQQTAQSQGQSLISFDALPPPFPVSLPNSTTSYSVSSIPVQALCRVIVRFNIGGTPFSTFLSTLIRSPPTSVLYRLSVQIQTKGIIVSHTTTSSAQLPMYVHLEHCPPFVAIAPQSEPPIFYPPSSNPNDAALLTSFMFVDRDPDIFAIIISSLRTVAAQQQKGIGSGQLSVIPVPEGKLANLGVSHDYFCEECAFYGINTV
ncbi:putative metallophosphoesterase family protein [Blattamonas nauphoetae]|uniref:Metallophosphoesterase family protein n=1 Tax=Blattamonas nauphoetae TaxID=2049346 RepID=A0ABQ9XMV0_9EUKA|nr:putative metallophosphoesterase family protein [Blattamonas nauphoetae]